MAGNTKTKPFAKEPAFSALSVRDQRLVQNEALRQVAAMERSGREHNSPAPFPAAEDRQAYAAELRRQFASDPKTLDSLRQADDQRALAHRHQPGH